MKSNKPRKKTKQSISPFEKAVKFMAKENYKKEKKMKENAILSIIESKDKLDHL